MHINVITNDSTIGQCRFGPLNASHLIINPLNSGIPRRRWNCIEITISILEKKKNSCNNKPPSSVEAANVDVGPSPAGLNTRSVTKYSVYGSKFRNV